MKRTLQQKSSMLTNTGLKCLYFFNSGTVRTFNMAGRHRGHRREGPLLDSQWPWKLSVEHPVVSLRSRPCEAL